MKVTFKLIRTVRPQEMAVLTFLLLSYFATSFTDWALLDRNIYFVLSPTPHLFSDFFLISPLMNGSGWPRVGGD